MAIDFTLTAQQRDLQRVSRKFAKEVLGEAKGAEALATPEERFLAIKRVVDIDGYDHEVPFARPLQDALALPIFGGGHMAIRRWQLHMMFKRNDYDPLAVSGAA